MYSNADVYGVIGLKFVKLPIMYTTQQHHLVFLSMKELRPEAITIHIIIFFHCDLGKHFPCTHCISVCNSLPNSVVDVCTVNVFKARLDKFWQHQADKLDSTDDLTATGRSHCLFVIVDNNDMDLEVRETPASVLLC